AHGHGYFVFHGNLPCHGLVSHLINGIRGGADEYNFIVATSLGEVCVFSQESVTRVNRVAPVLQGDGDQFLNIEEDGYLSQFIILIMDDVCKGEIHRIWFDGSADSDSPDAHFAGGTYYPDRDLSTVSD